MASTLLDLTERLVPISDFSQGKAGKIFADVSQNDHEYIILKNNQPTAVLVSIKEYRKYKSKIARMDKFLEDLENMRLLKMASSRKNNHTSSFEDLVAEDGFSLDEIKNLADSVEFE